MPFKSKNCLECGKELIVKCTRDLTRKKYCSHSCRMKYRYKEEPWDMTPKILLANTEESNKKKSHKGESHPSYIKDRSKVKRFRDRCESKDWKKKVLERDNYTCQICGCKGGKLNVDHILPYSLFEELREVLTNGRTLCEKCHKETSTYGSKLKNILREEFLIF